MKPDREFYAATLRVIDYITESGAKEITRAKLQELAGVYWRNAASVLNRSAVGYFDDNGSFCINHLGGLDLVEADCNHSLSVIDEEAADRRLRNAESKAAIKYGIRGYKISIIALIISGLSIAADVVLFLLRTR